MRLSKKQVDTLKQSVFEITPDCKIYLFGSRAHNNAKGGDIDILLESNYLFKLKDIFKIKMKFWKVCGEQKLDIIHFTPDDDSPFKKIAQSSAVEL